MLVVHAIDVELYINDDKELFRSLLLHKDEIESVMGCHLIGESCRKERQAVLL